MRPKRRLSTKRKQHCGSRKGPRDIWAEGKTKVLGATGDRGVVNLINPLLRGWVNYFAVGHSSECFSFIKDWVEVRRHLAHAQKRKGFGWERWSRRWLYDTLGLFNGYRVRRDRPKVAPAG